jgi:hypothetical protein
MESYRLESSLTTYCKKAAFEALISICDPHFLNSIHFVDKHLPRTFAPKHPNNFHWNLTCDSKQPQEKICMTAPAYVDHVTSFRSRQLRHNDCPLWRSGRLSETRKTVAAQQFFGFRKN